MRRETRGGEEVSTCSLRGVPDDFSPSASRSSFAFADLLNFRNTGSRSCIACPTLFRALPGSLSSFLSAFRFVRQHGQHMAGRYSQTGRPCDNDNDAQRRMYTYSASYAGQRRKVMLARAGQGLSLVDAPILVNSSLL